MKVYLIKILGVGVSICCLRQKKWQASDVAFWGILINNCCSYLV